MSTNRFGAYSQAVDSLVTVVEAFPVEEGLQVAAEGSGAGVLVTAVDDYAERSREVFASLMNSNAETTERILALAAGDFRLAASLAALGGPFIGDLTDDEAAAYAALRIDLADLRADMAEIKEAVLSGGDEPGGQGGPREPGPRPSPDSPVPSVVFPPLRERGQPARASLTDLITAMEIAPGEFETSRNFVLRGGGPDSSRSPVDRVADEIDTVVKQATRQISDLVVGGIPFAIESAAEFAGFLLGQLPQSYAHVQRSLGGFGKRAKRAAVKLLHEGLEKLLFMFRVSIPAQATGYIRRAAIEIATYLAQHSLENKINDGMNRTLKTRRLKTHVAQTFGPLSDEEAAERAQNVWDIGSSYRATKVQRVLEKGSFALRIFRVLKLQHVVPPWSQIAMGSAIAGLCLANGWLAQDFLDYPKLRFVPARFDGVRSAVDHGSLPTQPKPPTDSGVEH